MGGYMKNILKNFIFIFVLLIGISILSSCNKTNKYVISYETNGGTVIADKEVEEGKSITIPVIPTKEGYNFIGWFIDENLEQPLDYSTKVTSNITIYAKWEEIEKYYNINYVLDGGTNHDLNPYILSSKEEKVTLYPATKAGYEFIKWTLNGETVTELNGPFNSELELVAHYEIIEYTITYNVGNGTNSSENVLTYTIEDLPLVLHDATLPGKQFEGWYINGNKVLNITKAFLGNITINANYEDIYKITYSGVGADLVSNPKSYYTSQGSIPLELPVLEGYIFFGWYLNGRTVTSIPENTKGDITLITVYNYVEYNIVYELDGGINNDKNKSTYTRENTYISLKEPTKEGYVFVGWEYEGEIVKSLETSLCKDITVTAKWEVAPIYHNIFYMLNGGKVPTGTKTFYQEGVAHTLVIPTRDGYTFKGWNTSNDGSGEFVKEIKNTEVGEKTYYAIWDKIIVNSQITYELDGGTLGNDAKYTYEEGVSYELPIPTKQNFQFLGWYLNSDFSGNRIFVISENAKGDIVVYAKWKSNVDAYTITYNLNGGDFSKEIPYQTRTEMVNDFLNDINAHYKTNVSLSSFFDASYNFKPSLEDFFSSPSYKEKWTWMKTYIIDVAKTSGYSNLNDLIDESADYHNTFLRANIDSFINGRMRNEWPKSLDFSQIALRDGYVSYLPGKALEIIHEYYELSEDYILPNVFRNEYTFLGWYDEFDNLVTEIKAGTKANIVLNAKYESVYEIYTITYHLDGGSFTGSAMTQFIEKDEIILPTPVKDGYKFYAWFESPDFSTGEVFEIPKGTKRNIELYAMYNKLNYKITYNIETNNPKIYSIDTPTIVLQDAVKSGYEFLGWYTDSGIKVEQIEIGSTGDLKLNAEFRVIVDDNIKYKVTFIDQNGNTLSEQMVSHGRSASEILLGTYNELDLSWYLEGELYDFNSIVTHDITLNAYWSVIDEIYDVVFNTPVITDDLNMETYFETSVGTISVSWKTSNSSVLNTITGVINPEYDDTEIKVTATFKIGGIAMTLARNVIVGKVNFKDLSNIQPVFGYFYSRMASAEVDEVAGNTLDVINYGFARVTSDGLVDISELKYIEKITALRKRGMRVVLVIGGYGTACKEFSDTALTQEGRKRFAESILQVLQEYHFDGVDIDWEYPGYETGRDVSIDRPNFTLMMQEIKNTLKKANPEYLITAAIPGGKYGYTRYELNKLNNILDYVHLMTYDLQASGQATHHSGLYSGTGTPHGSAKQTVDLFASQGVSKNKLVVGIAFYGRKFNTSNYYVGSTSTTTNAASITYTDIYNNYLLKIQNGSTTIKRYWDETTMAPYIYDSSTRVWITYDDPESITAKCEYVKNNNLGGVMFWDYGEDQTYQLIYAIHDSMKK